MASELESIRQDLASAYRRRFGWADPVPALDGSHPEIARRQRAQHAVWLALRDLALVLDVEMGGARGHAERVAAISRQAAQALGLAPDEVLLVERAALLHDVGKAAVSEVALRRPPASEEGREVLRLHPVVGAQLVAPFGFLALAAPMIRHHHERYDGGGYPDGLGGDAIPLGARIIAVANTYDALASSGRESITPPAIARRLERLAGTKLDGAVVGAVVAVIGGR